MSPIDEFKKEKKAAGFFDSVKGGLSSANLGGAVGQGMATAGVGAGVAGIGMAASKIFDAMTKRHDFNRMLQSNPDLVEHHEQDPKKFNEMFTSLRSMNPEFSADPVVAGTYMRRMVESPLSAGGIAVEALGHRDALKSPTLDYFMRGGLEGAKKGMGAERPKKK